MVDNPRELDLDSLSSISGLTNAWAMFLYEAASISLEENGHIRGTRLTIEGEYSLTPSLLWRNSSSKKLSSWRDLGQAAEFGAYGIAIMLMVKLTEYKSIERAVKGSGIDYWLGQGTISEDSILFQKKARLEVSGIFKGNKAKVDERGRQKCDQTIQSDTSRLPAYIIIVEFGTPRSKIIKR